MQADSLTALAGGESKGKDALSVFECHAHAVVFHADLEFVARVERGVNQADGDGASAATRFLDGVNGTSRPTSSTRASVRP